GERRAPREFYPDVLLTGAMIACTSTPEKTSRELHLHFLFRQRSRWHLSSTPLPSRNLLHGCHLPRASLGRKPGCNCQTSLPATSFRCDRCRSRPPTAGSLLGCPRVQPNNSFKPNLLRSTNN